jgi:serpin B
LENGATKQVQMMQQTNAFAYTATNTYSAIRLPYGNGQFSMTILLPNAGNKIADVMNNFTANDWNIFQQDSLKTYLRVGLPRFTVPAYEVNLISTLQQMGVTDAFSPLLADFANMSPAAVGGLVFINIAQQNTYLNVDETGTEAAAVTTVGGGMTAPPPPPSFICDHPFGIIISENTSNTILFMGRIMNPQSE